MKRFLIAALLALASLPAQAQIQGIINGTTIGLGFTSGQCLTVVGTGTGSVTGASCGGTPSGAAGGDLTGTYPTPTLAASITSGAHTWNATQTVNAATTTSPSWEAQIAGDTNSRIAIGMNALDVPRISFGPGNAVRDTFLMRTAAASLQFGNADAASPVAQTLGVQNVVTGTSNTAGVNWTFKASQGTGTGASGSIIFQTAAAGSTGTSPNALSTSFTISGANITSTLPFVLPAGTSSLPSITGSDNTSGIYFRSSGVIGLVTSATLRFELASGVLRGASTSAISFTSGAANTAADVGLSRVSTGVLGIGTGAQGSIAGTISAANYVAGGIAGVSCSVGTVNPLTAVVTAGIITHC